METVSLLNMTSEMENCHNSLTTYNATTKRCVNLDWLEVHAREPIEEPHNADFYRAKGWIVHEREYGTRVYRQMFVLEGVDGENLLEVRREPASQGLNGIHEINECHIRLVNRTCYFDNAAEAFAKFLNDYGYTDIRISRVDICMDFVRFDKGDDPQAFVRRYFRHKYAKINQGRISGHGEDTWSGQEWNSLSWGSKSSAVGTKMYNKTMELYDIKTDSFRKPYIRQAWLLCGFIDDMQRVTKNGESVQVWRVEFSLRSAVKNWITIELDGKNKNYQSLRNSLECYFDRGRILVMFASLSSHYFHFKKFKQGQRKDRCEDKVLFDFSNQQVTYKIGRPDTAAGSGNNFHEKYARVIAMLLAYQTSHSNTEIIKACEVLINSMKDEDLRSNLTNPWSKEELNFLKLMMTVGTHHKDWDVNVVMSEVKRLLSITDRTINLF